MQSARRVEVLSLLQTKVRNNPAANRLQQRLSNNSSPVDKLINDRSTVRYVRNQTSGGMAKRMKK